jgi:mannose-6-phosphate isomerase-like protein (cupin superfamily)
MKIPTLDTEGLPNGYLQPIWNALDSPHLRPDQVYVTAIAPHSRKGPHLHMRRRGMFVCISGKTHLRALTEGVYEEFELSCWPLLVIPPGVPCALYNYGDTEALVLNMPSPAWSAEDPDDHPVLDWKDPEDWPHHQMICKGCGFDFHPRLSIPPHFGKGGIECTGVLTSE